LEGRAQLVHDGKRRIAFPLQLFEPPEIVGRNKDRHGNTALFNHDARLAAA